MSSRTTALRVAGALFGLFALVHVVRLLLGWDVRIAGQHVSPALSVVAAIVAAALSAWMWKLASDER